MTTIEKIDKKQLKSSLISFLFQIIQITNDNLVLCSFMLMFSIFSSMVPSCVSYVSNVYHRFGRLLASLDNLCVLFAKYSFQKHLYILLLFQYLQHMLSFSFFLSFPLVYFPLSFVWLRSILNLVLPQQSRSQYQFCTAASINQR